MHFELTKWKEYLSSFPLQKLSIPSRRGEFVSSVYTLIPQSEHSQNSISHSEGWTFIEREKNLLQLRQVTSNSPQLFVRV